MPGKWEFLCHLPNNIIELARLFKVSTDYLLGVDASTTINAIGLTEEDIQLVHGIVTHLK